MANKLDSITNSFPDEDFMLIEGFDDAVIGVDTDCIRLIYDVSKIVEILCEEGMDADDAVDYFEYTISARIPYSKNAPILIYTDFF